MDKLNIFEESILKVFAHYHRFALDDIQFAYRHYKSFDKTLNAMEKADFECIDLYDLIMKEPSNSELRGDLIYDAPKRLAEILDKENKTNGQE